MEAGLFRLADALHSHGRRRRSALRGPGPLGQGDDELGELPGGRLHPERPRRPCTTISWLSDSPSPQKMSVTQVFFTIVQIDEDIANIQSTEKLLQDRLNELNERVRLGKSRESEVLMIASQIASLKAQEEKEQGDRAGLMEDLSFLTGVAVSSLDILNDTPSVETIEPLDNYLSVAKNRSDVEAVRQDLLSQAYRVSISKGSFLPAINLDGSWYTTRSGSLSSSKWDASISLDMPLFQVV